MWLLLSDTLLGNLESGAFVALRPVGGESAELELVHFHLLQPSGMGELPLIRGDAETCTDAFTLLMEDLEAEDVLLQLLEGTLTEGDEGAAAPPGWLELDEQVLLNLNNNAVLSVAEGAGGFHVAYTTPQGTLTLYSGGRDEADAYLNALAAVLGVSDALLEAEAESDLRTGLLGALLSRVKKGQA